MPERFKYKIDENHLATVLALLAYAFILAIIFGAGNPVLGAERTLAAKPVIVMPARC